MKVALIGGRGYVGSEFLGLLAKHPQLELACASSRSEAGVALRDCCPGWSGGEHFVELSPDAVADVDARVWVLAVPNGSAAAWAEAILGVFEDAIVVDLSADHRFDKNWVYGLPERFRKSIRTSRRISNPGCYATGAQLGLLPLKNLLSGAPCVFGVSGYSGAGTTPSRKNDPECLRDNLIPYALSGHLHEREIGHQLAHTVRFMPHVASFFRGISLTVSVTLTEETTVDSMYERFGDAYSTEPRVHVQRDAPEIRQVQGTPDARIGGFSVSETDARQGVFVVVLDNLLKGAASQALQNINLALGLEEGLGLTV